MNDFLIAVRSTVALTLLAVLTFTLSASAQSTRPHNFNASTSEEMSPAVCRAGDIVRGVACYGSYCDEVFLSCRKSDWTDGRDGRFTRFFSEEEQAFVACPDGFILSGLSCRGSYCDDIALHCVRSHHRAASDCIETRAVSEEAPAYVGWPEDMAAVAVFCEGRFCDNKSFRICRLR